MKRSDTLEERLRALFDNDRFDIVAGPGEVVVEETEEDGRARIVCRIAADCLAIRWKLQLGHLRILASEKNADGAILVVRADGVLEAHVMECKQTIDSRTWPKALAQLEWTVVRLLAIAGALHERIERVVLYTAFFRNRLATDESVDSSLFELPLGGADDPRAKRERPMMRPGTETVVELPGWSSTFPLVKIRKDDQGHASVDLRAGDSMPPMSQRLV